MPIWRTTLVQTYLAPGGPGYSTFHFRHDGIESDLVADLTSAQTALINALGDLASELPNTTTWQTSGTWQDVDGDREVTTGRATVTGSAGAVAVLPSASALVLGWRTESRSRSGRGRTFLSGFMSAACVDGTPSGTCLSKARAGAAELVAWNAGFANGAWVVYSPTDGLSRDITGSQVRDVFAVLRSRRD